MKFNANKERTMNTQTIQITAFGETREVVIVKYEGQLRTASQRIFVGRFPTGKKLWEVAGTLYPIRQGRGSQVVAATVDGVDYALDATMYMLNRNRGRLYGWVPAPAAPAFKAVDASGVEYPARTPRAAKEALQGRVGWVYEGDKLIAWVKRGEYVAL